MDELTRIKVNLMIYSDPYGKPEIIDVSENIRNWDEVKISLSRKGYTGVVRSISTKFEFVREAKDRLFDCYSNMSLYLKTKAIVKVLRLNQRWEYGETFSGELDFGTVEYDGIVFSISAKENDFASILNSKKSTKFDIEYEDILKNEDAGAINTIKYDRMSIINREQWTSGQDPDSSSLEYQGNGETSDDGDEHRFTIGFKLRVVSGDIGETTYYKPIPLGAMEANMKYQPFIYTDQTASIFHNRMDGFPEDVSFLEVVRQEDFEVNVCFDINVLECSVGDGAGIMEANIIIGTPILDESGKLKTMIEYASQRILRKERGYNSPLRGLRERQKINLSTSLRSAEEKSKVGLYIKLYNSIGNFYESEKFFAEYFIGSEQDGIYKEGSILMVESKDKGEPLNFDCFSTKALLRSLIDKIKIDSMEISCQIDDIDFSYVLVAGESIRKLLKPKIHTSFNDFAAFMECCFGYTYTIIENGFSNYVIRFGKRDSLFMEEVTKNIENYSDFNFSQDTSLIYSSVKAGYDKQEYDNTNGRNEFNFTNEYTTGVNLTENTLEIKSKYRADSYGIEFLSQELEEGKFQNDNDDNKEDKDIFVIQVKENGISYIIDREIQALSNNGNVIFARRGISFSFVKELFINIENGFNSYYLIGYEEFEMDGQITGRIEIAAVMSTSYGYKDTANMYIEMQVKDSGVFSYSDYTGLIITVDWSAKPTPFKYTGGDLTRLPLSYEVFNKNAFNARLHPYYCTQRNAFIITPCTLDIEFASSEGNIDVMFAKYKEGGLIDFFKLNRGLKFTDRRITVNTISFSTSDTELPVNKDGLIHFHTYYGDFNGYIIEAEQNIGNNEAGEYKLILTQ